MAKALSWAKPILAQVSLVLLLLVRFPTSHVTNGATDASVVTPPRGVLEILRQPSCIAAILSMAASYSRLELEVEHANAGTPAEIGTPSWFLQNESVTCVCCIGVNCMCELRQKSSTGCREDFGCSIIFCH